MISWTLSQLLNDRKWTAYKLAQEADITIPVAYKLADPKYTPTRIDTDTLNKVCNALNVPPSKFMKWTRDK